MRKEIPPFDGFKSTREKDIALNMARREATQKLEIKYSKTIRELTSALETEQNNVSAFEKTIQKDREIYRERITGLLGDIENLIGILTRNPELLSSEDLQFIEELKEKMTEALKEVDKLE